MRRKSLLMLVAVMAVVWVGASANAEVIVLETFDGSGTALLNTTTADTGQTWIANSIVNDDGTLSTSNQGSALIPIALEGGKTYTLSIDAQLTSGYYLHFGFMQNVIDSPGASDAYDKFNTAAQGAFLVSAVSYQNGANLVQAADKYNEILGSTSDYSTTDLHTYSIVFTTAADLSTATASYYVDGVAYVTDGLIDFATLDTINYVGFGIRATGGTVDNFSLSVIGGIANTPDPSKGEDLVEVDLLARDVPGQLSWVAPDDYDDATFDVYFGTAEPNLAEAAPYGLTKLTSTPQSGTSIAPATLPLDNEIPYYWVVDAYEPNTVPILHQGSVWTFTTIPSNLPPVVTPGSSYITWLDELPQGIDATVADDDIASVTWEIISGPGIAIAADMQITDRGTAGILDSDPNLLRDWIGVDSRGANGANSDVLILTLSGLPSGTYNWKSYHYDRELEGLFDVTVTDSTGSTTYLDQEQGNAVPVPIDPNTFETTIVSNGSDVTLAFIGSDAAPDGSQYQFAMNGFELTGTGDPLFIDFSLKQTAPDPNYIMTGYQGYVAEQNVPESFTTKSYSAFGTTVSITPTWDAPGLEITSTGGTLAEPTATLSRNTAAYLGLPDEKITGTYTVQVTATDGANDPVSGTLTVEVAADACAAALANGATLNDYDTDGNCVVDLPDLAAFASKWLENKSLTGPEPY